MRQAIKILRLKEDRRNEKDLKDKILPLLQELSFFQDKQKDMSERDWIEILKRVKHECIEPGETLFNQGDSGNKFYIILKGHVQVSISCKNFTHNNHSKN